VQTVRDLNMLRESVAAFRAAGQRVALVPTMGALHAGHVALIEAAKRPGTKVVTSIFVNPKQFGPNEDLARYPRREMADVRLLNEVGCDLLWAPGVDVMYPEGFATNIAVAGVSEGFDGAARPGHFDGVATVVAKLFNQVGADAAYFGEKDFQQLQIIRRMVEDMAQPVEVVGVATVREADGLACSSRNVYLTPEERSAAAIVPKALDEAERLITGGVTDVAALEKAVTDFIASEPLAKPEVVALRDPETLHELTEIGEKPVLLLLFIRFGSTKLLDNRVFSPKTAKFAKVA